jgi:heat-inducible transcriptional repressor
VSISSASIRSVLGELAGLGLVEQPHPSAGRVPTDRGLRLFVDELLDPAALAAHERRTIAYSVEEADVDAVVNVASQLLSERTHQLGFVVAPRIDRLVLQHVSLVRLTSERVLVVLVSQAGAAYRRVVEDEGSADQAELDRISELLNERAVGRTLREVREVLAGEARALRRKADRLLTRAIDFGTRVLSAEGGEAVDLVIETRLALFDQPEFHDPRRVRDLFEAVETKERLLEVLDQVLEGSGVTVAFGDEVDEPSLHRCAVVASRYGGPDAPLGALGVIGPSRMDYSRVIPLVDYFSHVITEKLTA